MHSRIIELGNAPILPDDRMGECSVPEWFYHSIADYTDTETDRDEDLKWFLEIVAHIVDVAEDGESFTFKPNAKKKYFHRQYYAFLDKARELTGISIEAFCAETPYDIGMAMYKLNEAYQDKFSFYIYYQDKLKTRMNGFARLISAGLFILVGQSTITFEKRSRALWEPIPILQVPSALPLV